MLETILNLIPAPLLNAGGVAAFTVPCTWGIIEFIFKRDTSATKNRVANLCLNVGAFVGLQATDLVVFGAGGKGLGAAAVLGVLTSGLTEVLHIGIKKFAPSLTRPSNG